MPILPLRGLGTSGIIKDNDPFDLKPTAFSYGANVRFDNGVVSRGPVFRDASSLPRAANDPATGIAGNPYFVDSIRGGSGNDTILVGFGDGKVYSYGSNADGVNISPTDWVANSSTAIYTSCRLANVFYVNREDHVPWYMLPNTYTLSKLTNWDATWRTKILRSYNSQLIALNVTLGAVEYPTMVKWSEYTPSGAVPSTWDAGDPTSSAGDNILADMRAPILDGLSLRSSFMIYSKDETWEMTPSGNSAIYSFRRLFNDRGVIGTNCVVEIDGRHYVFGTDDIYVHDGSRPMSIADGRVREYIFSTMNKKYVQRFFVTHHRDLSEVLFCYVSGDGEVYFRDNDGGACNRAASYNYVSDTWTFYDLPQVTGSGVGNIGSSETYESIEQGLTYDIAGGSYLDQEDGYKNNVFMVGVPDARYELTSRQLYIMDHTDYGNVLFPINRNATRPAILGRTGIDLDEIQAELRGYKHITAIYPEGRVARFSEPLSFSFGSGVYPEDNPLYGPAMTYNGLDLYKLDYRDAGRYLAYRIEYPDIKNFTLSGIDLDITITGSR